MFVRKIVFSIPIALALSLSLSSCKEGSGFSSLKNKGSAREIPKRSNTHAGSMGKRRGSFGSNGGNRQARRAATPDSDRDFGRNKGYATCRAPRSSNGFGVDTDGGAKNGSRTHQSQQSYQHVWGATLDPSKVYGAVNTRQDGLTGGDIICYKNNSNGKRVCGVVFDNAYTRSQSVARSTRTGKLKPEEATAPIHMALGASYASGRGTSLSKTKITAQPVKLSSEDRAELIQVLREARRTGNYRRANKLIQEKARGSGCASPAMMG